MGGVNVKLLDSNQNTAVDFHSDALNHTLVAGDGNSISTFRRQPLCFPVAARSLSQVTTTVFVLF